MTDERDTAFGLALVADADKRADQLEVVGSLFTATDQSLVGCQFRSFPFWLLCCCSLSR